jgi:excisionase family DNA binding protein
MNQAADTEIVDLKTMAQILKVSPDTVRALAISGEIPAFKVGRLWRLDSAAVLAHLARPRDPWEQSTQSRSRKTPD